MACSSSELREGAVEKNVSESVDWGQRAREGFLASGIDPADRRGHKNYYIDLLQKMALDEVLELKGNEIVLDFGCGSGRMTYWIAPKVKKVVGLERTPEMIQLAKENRKSENIELMVYDGIHFPLFPYSFDLILSVGVLQYMENDALKNTVSVLAKNLDHGGKFYLIEQASDNLKISRPTVEDYLRTFKGLHLRCSQHYPIRNGRWWLLYLIRYGLIPHKCFPRLALWELKKNRKEEGKISYYKDYLFLIEKA
jgi:SAM-dependent methyltransferase